MADISAEIAAFKNAVYGEDVRNAMVSLANKLNISLINTVNTVQTYDDLLEYNTFEINEINSLVHGKVLLDWHIGSYGTSGFDLTDTRYCYAELPYIENDKYWFPAIPTDIQRAVYKYVSDSQGVVVFGSRSTRISFRTQDQVADKYIIVAKDTNNKFTNNQNEFLNTVNLLVTTWLENDYGEIGSIQRNVTELQNIVSEEPLITNPVDTWVSTNLAELYIVNNSNISNNDLLLYRATKTTSNWDIVVGISESPYFMCRLAIPISEGIVVGKVYHLTPTNPDDYDIEAWVVYKNIPTNDASKLLTLSNNVFNIEKWKTIKNYFTNMVVKIENSLVSPQAKYKIVCIGDSILGMERGSTSIPDRIAYYTGATVYNCALGGTRGSIVHTGSSWPVFDFQGLYPSIVSGDYTTQSAHVSDSGVPNYFSDVITMLNSIDFSEVDLMTISYGGNDYTAEVCTIEQFKQDMSTGINAILAAYPNIRFILITPPYKFFVQDGQFVDDGDTHENAQGLYMTDFVNAHKEISETLHCPLVNFYRDLGINRYNREIWHKDGSHPNEYGRDLSARLISSVIKRM